MARKAIVCSVIIGFLGTCMAGEVDVPGFALKITLKDMGKEKWAHYARSVSQQYNTWQQDNPSGDLKRFLDDRLLVRALWVPSGEIKGLKKFMYWLALYGHFREPMPSYMRKLSQKHRQHFEALFSDFSWERFSAMVTSKAKDTKSKKAKDNQDAQSKVVHASPQDKKPPSRATPRRPAKVFMASSR